ncbi:uracil-DNA glycosylase family protein [uncultured Cohaesibacter sp.]|uniref:uracil-DNA glycosylase family protein n=1 Tax=uncultured Cohaesibacter sp. TaxID=1002546 RepID=UPI0029307A9C|nr:uracil-DNA glycosylase family protein [uncultured Cohaesibacter sp.]
MNETLVALEQAIALCRMCVDTPDKAPLPHEPRPVLHLSGTAKICIAGQAPGRRVHLSGLPFDDPSGDRLRDWMGIGRDIFYDKTRIAIVPMGFCFPGNDDKGGDLPPRKECLRHWHDRIFAAMPQLELILVIGQYAQKYHLGKLRQSTLTQTVSNAESIYKASSCPRYFPLPHPSWRNTAWMKTNPWFAEKILPLLRQEVARKLD